jgi:hypothetical protein
MSQAHTHASNAISYSGCICDVVGKNVLLAWLTSSPDIYIFGGLVKHIINPASHPTFSDVDAIAISPAVATQLRLRFGYRFIEVSKPGHNPRYLLGKSSSHHEVIQLLEMRSEAEAQIFIYNAQYDIDRVTVSNHQLEFDPAIDRATILRGINEKTARRVSGPRNMRLFAANRQQIEQRHKLKLLRKGFTVYD